MTYQAVNNKNIRFKTSIRLVGIVPPFRGTENANKINEKPALKNNAPFRSCISKINDTFINNAKYLDIVMPMYNLL